MSCKPRILVVCKKYGLDHLPTLCASSCVGTAVTYAARIYIPGFSKCTFTCTQHADSALHRPQSTHGRCIIAHVCLLYHYVCATKPAAHCNDNFAFMLTC